MRLLLPRGRHVVARAVPSIATAMPLARPAAPLEHSALAPAGIQAEHIARLWQLTLIVCGCVFAAVLIGVLFALMRRRGATPATPPDLSVNVTPAAINHKTIARRFIATTFAFFLLAGVLALVMRLQLSRPGNHVVGPDTYDALFTLHGTTMMFLFAVPVMQAVAGYLIPLMIGARSIAFPRMNAYAYWMFLFGGITLYVLALVATAFLAFGLWVHHMFATSIPALGKSFFTAASVMIAVPSGIQIYCWIATLVTGRLDVKAPLRFVLAFFFILVIGGMTGIMLGAVPLDLQLHDTYFVVAHLHYALLGGAVFPLFGAFYYWFPKITGRLLGERMGRWQFWLFFIGFNVTFFPMHLLGLHGMPRRVWTYPSGMGWSSCARCFPRPRSGRSSARSRRRCCSSVRCSRRGPSYGVPFRSLRR